MNTNIPVFTFTHHGHRFFVALNPEDLQAMGMNTSFQDILNQSFNHQPIKKTPSTSENVLKSLPTFTYTPAREKYIKECGSHNLDHSCCGVCLEEYETMEKDKLIQLPCQHIFHNQCARPWLSEHNTCPTCRFELSVDDADQESERIKRMTERFGRDGVSLMEVGCQAESIFERIQNAKDALDSEFSQFVDEEIKKLIESDINKCDASLMQFTLIIDGLQEFKEERLKASRRQQIKKIQYMTKYD
ncbi:E3 ubiquitin-protein ligase RING1-like [Acrasis kona]|uniref:E3 ubiquitin-protein ligase RING1-like n=1 Tax=Acrasis kona TaxID=1008807 RepID=A0AAW2Z140_9EUKA